LLAETRESFGEATSGMSAVNGLLDGVSTASRDQFRGIGQINRSVGEMDGMVQQNAANAQEAASASEQLRGQSDYLRIMVHNLSALVNGARSDGPHPDRKQVADHRLKPPAGAPVAAAKGST
jgi:methyl-accepting chemotaxis protein